MKGVPRVSLDLVEYCPGAAGRGGEAAAADEEEDHQETHSGRQQDGVADGGMRTCV